MDAEAPLSRQELATVLGTLIVLSGEAHSGGMPLDVMLHLRQRLIQTGALRTGQSVDDAIAVLDDLIQRLHRVCGDAPDLDVRDEPVESLIAFADEGAARDFVEDMRAQDKKVDAPVYEEAFRRWTVVVRTRRLPDGGHRGTVGQEVLTGYRHGGWHLGAR